MKNCSKNYLHLNYLDGIYTRVLDPGGVNPDPTFEEKPNLDPDPTPSIYNYIIDTKPALFSTCSVYGIFRDITLA